MSVRIKNSSDTPREDLSSQLQETGQNLVLGLFSLLRTAAIHDSENRALDRPVSQVLEALEPFVKRAHGRFSVVASEGQIYADDIRVRLPTQSHHIGGELEALLAEKGAGGISFETLPGAGQLRAFAHAFQDHVPPSEGDPYPAVRDALAAVETGGVGVTRPVRAQFDGAELSPGGSARVQTTLTYAKAVSALSQLLADPRGRARLRHRHMQRVVHEIADCAAETLEYLIGLTDHTSNRRDPARLCVDTCVVAIALARAMALPRAFIADIGAATMSGLSPEETAAGTPSEPAVKALRDLAKASHWSTALLRRTLILAQRGQPVRGSAGLPDQYPLARIHRVARDYVALTHGVVPDTLEDREELTPFEALSFLSQSPPSVYDPLVVSRLVRIVGMYPVGTLLQLADGKHAYVVDRGDPDDPVLLIREGHNQFGERLHLSQLFVPIVGVAVDVDPSERSVALLGGRDQEAVREAGRAVGRGSALGRVQLKRIAVRREPDE